MMSGSPAGLLRISCSNLNEFIIIMYKGNKKIQDKPTAIIILLYGIKWIFLFYLSKLMQQMLLRH